MKLNRTWADSPAFPYSLDEAIQEDNYLNESGLSKREYFAAMALQGLLASFKPLPLNVEELAVLAADQLIEALNKNEKS